MRSIGYPLLMILTGVCVIYSFKVLLLSQFLMSIIMPILFYKSLNNVITNSKFSLIATFAFVGSFIPFLHAKSIMTEQIFLFILMCATYLITSYYNSRTTKMLILLIISLILLTLIRPSAKPFFIITMIYSLLFLKRDHLLWTLGLAVFIVINSACGSIFCINTNPFAKIHGIKSKYIGNAFYHAYLYGFGKNLTYTELLKTHINNKITTSPESLHNYSALRKLYNQIPTRNESTEIVFEEPNIVYFNYVVDEIPYIVKEYNYKYDAKLTEKKLIHNIILEAFFSNPKLIFSYIKTYILGKGNSFAGQLLFYHSYVAMPQLNNNGKDPNSTFPLTGIHNSKLYQILRTFVYMYPENWHPLYPEYKDKPESFLEDVFIEQPNFNSLWLMWNATDILLTPAQAQPYFLNAAWENIIANKTTTVLMYLNNILYMTFGSTSDFFYGRQRIGLVSPIPDRNPADFLQSNPRFINMYHEVIDSEKSHPNIYTMENIVTLLNVYYTIIKIITSTLILTGVILISRSANYKAVYLILLIWMAHIAVCSIFGEPVGRYTVQILPLHIFIASTSLYYIAKYFRSYSRAREIIKYNNSYTSISKA